MTGAMISQDEPDTKESLRQQLTHAQAVIAKIRSHSKPVRMVVDHALVDQKPGSWGN